MPETTADINIMVGSNTAGPSTVDRIESELTRQGILLLIFTAMLILVSFSLSLSALLPFAYVFSLVF